MLQTKKKQNSKSNVSKRESTEKLGGKEKAYIPFVF